MADQPGRIIRPIAILRATGIENIDHLLKSTGRPYRLCHLRTHFAANPASSNPSSAPANLTLSLEAAAGDEYNLDLYKFIRGGGVGIGRDAHAIFGTDAAGSSWIFESGDTLRVQWINPGGVRWGLEVGIVGIG